MKNAVIGNGVNIQFGGFENCSNKAILSRLEVTDINHLCLQEELFVETNSDNKYLVWDGSINNTSILQLLKGFAHKITGSDNREWYLSTRINNKDNKKVIKKLDYLEQKYAKKDNSYKYHDIGIEDYFLFLELFGHYDFKPILEYIFKILIYNKGRVNDTIYSEKFRNILKSYSTIFTTNYDNVIESNIDKNVVHLHGQFDALNVNYDKSKLSGFAKLYINEYDDGIEQKPHLFSNAIFDYSGENKMKMIKAANIVSYFNEEQYTLDDIAQYFYDRYEESFHESEKRSQEELKCFIKENGVAIADVYGYDTFNEVEGEVDIIGLSPYNDTHLFKTICSNDMVRKIRFYYYEFDECSEVKRIMNNKNIKIEYIDVKTLF